MPSAGIGIIDGRVDRQRSQRKRFCLGYLNLFRPRLHRSEGGLTRFARIFNFVAGEGFRSFSEKVGFGQREASKIA